MDEHTVMADSSQVFSAWAKARQSAKHRPLSAESVQAYRSVWNVWCEFLASCTLPWAQAQSADVHRFLSNLPASKSGRAAATTVTQARYARLLRQIYAFAVVQRWAWNATRWTARRSHPPQRRMTRLSLTAATGSPCCAHWPGAPTPRTCRP